MSNHGWNVKDRYDRAALHWDEVATPIPGATDLVVRVHAAGINYSDLLMIQGAYQVRPALPFVPGQEVAGEVVSAPQGSPFTIGQRVAGKVMYGGWANMVALRQDMAFAVPDNLSWLEAAVVPVVWPTAHIGLMVRGNLQPGETVLIHAAAGGVGQAAVQLAKVAGARVLAAVGNRSKVDSVLALGADEVLVYDNDDWVAAVLAMTMGRGVDVVFDSVGGAITDLSIKCLARGGRLLIVGFSSGVIPKVALNRLLLRNAAVVGVYWSHDLPLEREWVDNALHTVCTLLRAGQVNVGISRVIAPHEVPAALDDLASRRTHGKIAIEFLPSVTKSGNQPAQ